MKKTNDNAEKITLYERVFSNNKFIHICFSSCFNKF